MIFVTEMDSKLRNNCDRLDYWAEGMVAIHKWVRNEWSDNRITKLGYFGISDGRIRVNVRN